MFDSRLSWYWAELSSGLGRVETEVPHVPQLRAAFWVWAMGDPWACMGPCFTVVEKHWEGLHKLSPKGAYERD